MKPYAIYMLRKDIGMTITLADNTVDEKLHAMWVDLDQPDTDCIAAFEKLLGDVRTEEECRRLARS